MGDEGSVFRLVCPPQYDARGGRPCDYYPTPSWCVEALLRRCPPPAGLSIVEPSAGEGAIVRACTAMGRPVALAVELREECRPALMALPIGEVLIGDWLRLAHVVGDCHAIVGNPPYTIAESFARACLTSRAPYVALLLPLGFLASAERAPFWAAHPVVRMIVLSRRPSFTGDGKTDSTDYAWMIWGDMERGIEWALLGEM